MRQISHINSRGEANMVDISHKVNSERSAIARAYIGLTSTIVRSIVNDNFIKGDLYATARIAGIQAAKKCSELIPLCHPLPVSKVSVEVKLEADSLIVTAECKTMTNTGVEMEALTAASVASLTLYDMCKGIDKGIVIRDISLLEKRGGKSGDWISELYQDD